MKRLILLITFYVFFEVRAQNVGELLRQKKTQKKYLLQQIAALRVYTGYVQKGYAIARQGLSTIRDLKRGEFNLHNKFFNALKNVNPRVRNYTKVAKIIATQVRIVQTFNRTYRQVKDNKLFSRDEANYISDVFERLIDECAANIDELIATITDSKLEMKDDERLKRIDALYNDIQGAYCFVQDFSNETRLLAVARTKEKKDVQNSRLMNGTKNP